MVNAFVSRVRVMTTNSPLILSTLLDMVIDCTPEDTEHPGPTMMNVEIFSPGMAGKRLVLEKTSPLEWRHKGVKIMDEATFRTTWDESGRFGLIHVTKAELAEFITNTDPHHSKHVASMLINATYVRLAEVAGECVIEMDDLGFKMKLRYEICWIPPDENLKKLQQIERKLQFGIEMAEEPEKIFMMVLELSDDVPEKLRFLGAFQNLFLERMTHDTSNKRELDNCILAFESVVHLIPQDHVGMATQLNLLGMLSGRRFELTGELSDISKAISSLEKVVHLTPQGHPNIAGYLNFLGTSLGHRFRCTGDLTDISEAISSLQKAVHLTPQGHPDMRNLLAKLGGNFKDRFERTRDLVDLSEAISCFQKEVDLTPQGDAGVSARLSSSFMLRFQCTGNLVDISEAVSFQQKAVNLTPQDHDDMPDQLKILGIVLAARFALTGNLADISEAISSQRQAVHLTSQGHADMAGRLSSLGTYFGQRFQRTGDPADIYEALSSQRKALHLARGGVEMAEYLIDLGNSFTHRFKHTREVADISEAILSQQKAVDLTLHEHSDMPSHLIHLGNSFQLRFQHTGDLSDISKALSFQKKAVNLTPKGDASMPTRLGTLGSSFRLRFEHSGDLTDISEAISYHQRAVHLTPEGYASMPEHLDNLGMSLTSRFEHTGDLTDISEAILSHQNAVNLTPHDHTEMPGYLSNLGSCLGYRFRRTRDLTDMAESVSSLQKAIDLTPQGHPDIPAWLSNLGTSFMFRFGRTGDLTDISEAISCQQKAVYLTPQGHEDMPGHLCCLGNSFQTRFEHTGELSDISEAISSFQKAVNLTPQGHARMPSYLNNLGMSYQDRFRHTRDLTDIQAAISNYTLSSTYSSGPPSRRLHAAILWARCSQVIALPESLTAYNTAIQLVSQVAGLEQTIQQRHTSLLDISDLAASAASCAFGLGKPDLALEWLEHGRCLVWSQLNNLRTPLDALLAHDEALANDMLRVSRALEKAGSRGDSPILSGKSTMERKMSLQDEAASHVKLAQEWNQLLANIRAIPDFEDFLQPPSCSSLLKYLPDSGPVVVINVHEDSCDALALVSGSDEPIHIPLPNFSYTKANGLRNQLNIRLRFANLRMRGSELDDTAIRKGRPVENTSSGGIKPGDILCQLWYLVVKPILDGLGFSAEPVSNLPRIWWCATGPLAFLPIHAAGVYATSTTKAGSTLSDFAVSSYIPTVRALSERIKSPQAVNEKKMGLFMVSQPETPNMTRIPGTTREVRAIKNLLEHHNLRVLCLESKAATVKEGLTNMETYSCIHFACHASQNTLEPLKSRFILQDGNLELSAVIKMNLVGADLAYLSACQTSTGDEKLSEEAVHLAAGMLAAGYRGVVATMWSISDHHGPQIAEDFYASLITHGEKSESLNALSGDNAARALHHATQTLRRKLGDDALSLLVWIPYVHFGL